MKKVLKNIREKLTLGLIISGFVSFVFAILLKLGMEQGIHVYPIRGGFNWEDILYFFSIFS